MDAEDFAGYDGGYGEAVEDVDERFPDFDTCTSFAFVVESVHYKEPVSMEKQGNDMWIPLVTLAHSWFPRRRKKFSGHRTLSANKRHTVSRLCRPASS